MSNTQLHDEINSDLTSLFALIKKNVLIFFMILLSVVFGGLVLAYSLPKTYLSESELMISENQSIGGAGNFSQINGLASLTGINLPTGSTDKTAFVISTLKSREFIRHLMSFDEVTLNVVAAKSFDVNGNRIIYNNSLYDENNKQWVDKAPSYLDVHRAIQSMLNVSRDRMSNFIHISFEHISPVFAKEFLDLVIFELNEAMRSKDLLEAEKSLDYLRIKKSEVVSSDIKETINDLIKSQLKIQVLSNVKEDYLLTIIDEPYIPDKRHKPQRKLIVFISFILGLIFATIIVIAINYFKSRQNYQIKE